MRAALLAGVLFIGVSFNSPTVSPDPTPASFKTSGQNAAYLLYRGYEKRTGEKLRPMAQGKAPSCVGAATAKALQIMHGTPFSAEWAYGVSRYERNAHGAGSFAGWAADAAKVYGMLPAAHYAAIGEDYTHYSVKRASDYGVRGPPEYLLPLAEKYRSPGYYKIHSWEELRGAISQGFPVIIGSNVGFGSRSGQVKSRDGSLSRRWWSRWNHAMVFIGVDDRPSSEPGALIMNSWGTRWVSGPKRFSDEPDGCFWASKSTVQRMVSQGDAYVIRPIPGL